MTTAVQDRPVSSRDQRPARAKARAGRVYLYLVPAAVMLVAIFAVPLVDSVVLSLQNSVGIAGTAGWAGFSNFASRALQQRFLANNVADDNLDSGRRFTDHGELDSAGVPTQASISGPDHFHRPS